MNILVDTSVWIEYFRSGEATQQLDRLIDENLIATNDLILAELVPVLRIRRQKEVISRLEAVRRLPLVIDWGHIVEMQVKCLKHGLNHLGIPDLIIAQNAIQHGATVYSIDRHFSHLRSIIPLNILT